MRTPLASKLVLVADQRPDVSPPPPRVRRYRLARLRFEGRASSPDARFEHLKRTYD